MKNNPMKKKNTIVPIEFSASVIAEIADIAIAEIETIRISKNVPLYFVNSSFI